MCARGVSSGAAQSEYLSIASSSRWPSSPSQSSAGFGIVRTNLSARVVYPDKYYTLRAFLNILYTHTHTNDRERAPHAAALLAVSGSRSPRRARVALPAHHITISSIHCKQTPVTIAVCARHMVHILAYINIYTAGTYRWRASLPLNSVDPRLYQLNAASRSVHQLYI